MELSIRTLMPDDWPAVRAIYLEGIASGISTFEVEAPDWDKWDQGHRQNCRLVAMSPDGSDPWLGGIIPNVEKVRVLRRG